MWGEKMKLLDKNELTGRENMVMKCVWDHEGDISAVEIQRALKEQFGIDFERSIFLSAIFIAYFSSYNIISFILLQYFISIFIKHFFKKKDGSIGFPSVYYSISSIID